MARAFRHPDLPSREDDPLVVDWPGNEAGIVLFLDEFIADANGEVVLFNDSRVRLMTLVTTHEIEAEGECGAHTTAAGVDVSGHRYYQFDNGLKLYYGNELNLVVGASAA
jgi:hypothetical protein